MVAERITVMVDPEGECARLIEQATDAPLVVELAGQRYRFTREPDDPFADYDPERAAAAFDRAFGILAGVDREALKAKLREQRDQDSRGRPA